MLDQLFTGIALGVGILWVLIPFRDYILPYRKWVDIGLACALIYLLLEVQTNFVMGLTTWAGITISAGLRIWHFISTFFGGKKHEHYNSRPERS